MMQKKRYIAGLLALLVACTMLLAGCVAPQPSTSVPGGTNATVPSTQNPATVPTTDPTVEPTAEPTEPTQESTPAPTEGPAPEEGTAEYYMQVVYAQQIQRYSAALTQQWNDAECSSNGVSPLLAQYYAGNAMDNVGVGFVDFENDDSWELIIGAVQNSENDPLVFEIWTLIDGEPQMVAQSDAQNRYYLQYSEEDALWYVAWESTRSQEYYGVHFLMLQNGVFEMVQAIVYNAAANPAEPWFMAFDTDMDTSNDERIDEMTAMAILQVNRNLYCAAEYAVFSSIN